VSRPRFDGVDDEDNGRGDVKCDETDDMGGSLDEISKADDDDACGSGGIDENKGADAVVVDGDDDEDFGDAPNKGVVERDCTGVDKSLMANG
jgi:hypothetical protein